MHVNKFRPFIAGVEAVMYESDTDFGRVVAAPANDRDGNVELLPTQNTDRECIAHLSTEQQEQLLQLLDRYAVCFSDKPGLFNIIEHAIVTLDCFQPRQAKPYRLAESLKPLVN